MDDASDASREDPEDEMEPTGRCREARTHLVDRDDLQSSINQQIHDGDKSRVDVFVACWLDRCV